MTEYEYVGCFFDYEEFTALVAPLRSNPLPCSKLKPHVTFKYMPETVNTRLFGTEITATVTGYGNNGTNEGLRVELQCANAELRRMIGEIEIPHITIAVSESGRAVDTKYLDFAETEPIVIRGRYDGHIDT